VLMGIYDHEQGTITLGNSTPELNQYDDSLYTGKVVDQSGNISLQNPTTDKVVGVNYQQYGIYVLAGNVQVVRNNVVGNINWSTLLQAEPGTYQAGISIINARRADTGTFITGTIAINELDNNYLIVNWDEDSFPTNTVLENRSNIDYIIDPQRTVPDTTPGTRLLLLGNVGNINAADGPTAWKNRDNTDFIAGENDLVEYDGTRWRIVLDASETPGPVYTQNLATGIQYFWNGTEWNQTVDGYYPVGSWYMNLDG